MGQASSLFSPTFSEDEAIFTPARLAEFDAIVFLSNSEGLLASDSEVLTTSGKAAFQGWLEGGGALVGLHAGTACLYRDPVFGVAMGSWCVPRVMSGRVGS
jgi:hypothetical protein